MGKARNIADLLNSSGKIDSADIDSSAQFYQFKNRIINGDCRIDQRNAGASVTASTTGAVVYTLDRFFYVATAASKFNIQLLFEMLSSTTFNNGRYAEYFNGYFNNFNADKYTIYDYHW